ncbi:Ferredoxin-like, FixX [Syntrophomonas zehnderi OL-4]|uniref:Ferredoxin-like protein n=1 Tax=Syntrophomonas zehnderi OL-4 TaxID=690567 RepID=A0A0E3W3T1_9FIRM|nr:4Fe-4S dicluster domain-containing protein [Syntrophomonas zehnderi]CFY03058.1 Ferredoxin-like, FixX [Syntrophomonas zehnderi OL-4]
MSELMGLKAKLGLDVFKHDKEAHIKIKPGMEKDPRLKRAVWVCPAGLYSENDQGEVELTIDGCLECGTCRIACGIEVLEWNYPNGGCGVQFRFG